MVDYRPCIACQQEFFCDFLGRRLEILLMRIAYRRKNYHIGTNHRLQPRHLATLRYTGLDDGNIALVVHHKQRQRHTQLRIVTAWRTEQIDRCGSALRNPLLDNRFTVGTRNGHYPAAILRTMLGCQLLQCGNRIGNLHHSAIRRQSAIALYHECAYSAFVHRLHVIVGIVIYAPYGNEQRIVLYGRCTTVCRNGTHRKVGAQKHTAADMRHIGQKIFHLSQILKFTIVMPAPPLSG